MISKLEFDNGNSKEYKVEEICNNVIHVKQLEDSHLQNFY